MFTKVLTLVHALKREAGRSNADERLKRLYVP
jgi:hypothetical protein